MSNEMNRWALTDEVKQKYTPIVQQFIDNVESASPEDEILEKDFSDTELNPYTLWKLLEQLGYKETEIDDNGWQMDFWITFEKNGFKSLYIKGTGITFELSLCKKD